MKKWVEIVLGVILGLLLLFRGAELWVGSKIKKIAASELNSASNGIYKLEMGNVTVGLFDRSIKIRNISIVTDSMRLDQLALGSEAIPAAERHYKPGINLSAAELFIKGIRFKRHHPSNAPDTTTSKYQAKGDLHSSISKTFDKLIVNRIRVRGLDGEFSVRKNNDTLYYSINRATIEADDYNMAADPQMHPFYCQDVRITVREFEHTYQFRSMTLRADTIQASTAKRNLSINSLNIDPNYDKEKFAYMNPMHKDWTFFKLGNLTVSGIEVAGLAYRKHLAANTITVGRIDLGSYKNRNVERIEWPKYMFYESLRKLPLTIDVKFAEIASGTAYYEELPKGDEKAGTIRFSDMQAKVTNLSNMEQPAVKHITINASARLMGSGVLTIEFIAPASTTDNQFVASGTLGPMAMNVMNPLVEPLAKVRIDSGEINSINFRITGDTNTANSDITMLYNGLSIAIMKENKLGHLRDRVFISALANDFVIRDSNPNERGKVRYGHGTVERDFYKSQFNYLWKSLLPGIEETLGIPKSFIK